MKKLILLSILLSSIIAQQYSKVYLKNGDMYVCAIIENNEELQKYVIEIKGGSRINIDYSDVESIELIPIAKKGSFGYGFGNLYSNTGFNLNYFLTDNISLLVGYGTFTASNEEPKQSEKFSAPVFGVRYFFKSFSDIRRPVISISYGEVGISKRDSNVNNNTNLVEFTQHKGVRLGVGAQFMFGKKKKHGFDFEYCYHIVSEYHDYYLENKEIWGGDNSPSRVGFSLGYRYAFNSLLNWKLNIYII